MLGGSLNITYIEGAFITTILILSLLLYWILSCSSFMTEFLLIDGRIRSQSFITWCVFIYVNTELHKRKDSAIFFSHHYTHLAFIQVQYTFYHRLIWYFSGDHMYYQLPWQQLCNPIVILEIISAKCFHETIHNP